MSDFLERIAARALNVADVIRPRVPSRFEPAATRDSGAASAGDLDIDSRQLSSPPAPPERRDAAVASTTMPSPSAFAAVPPSIASVQSFRTDETPRADRIELPHWRSLDPMPDSAAEQASPLLPRSTPTLERTPPAAVALRGVAVDSERGKRTDPEATQAEQRPEIRVTIGRIEVRAVQRAEAPPKERPAQKGPALSLDDYLKQSHGRSR